jgi:hypothetical protein
VDDEQALAQIRNAVEILERHDRERRTLGPGSSIRTAHMTVEVVGQDVIAIPFYYAAHKVRSEITRRAFRHFRRVADEVGARVIGLGSEGLVSRALWCEIFDEVDYHEYPQTWNPRQLGGAGSEGLRQKFDETVRRARVHNPSRVFIGGSDDVIPMQWWQAAWKSEADLIGVGGGAMIVRYGARPDQSVISAWDGHYQWAPDIEFCGGGVVMSRDLLDSWEWAPFRDPHCEIGLERRARSEGWRVETIEGRFWAVKVQGAVLNEANRAGRAGAVAALGAEVREEWIELWAGLA